MFRTRRMKKSWLRRARSVQLSEPNPARLLLKYAGPATSQSAALSNVPPTLCTSQALAKEECSLGASRRRPICVIILLQAARQRRGGMKRIWKQEKTRRNAGVYRLSFLYLSTLTFHHIQGFRHQEDNEQYLLEASLP
jgi:hypothetical protein